MEEQDILHEVIKGHRLLLAERYDYDRIKADYEMPASFTFEKVGPLRVYFLDYIYPDTDKRDELDKAFESLDDHIKHPEQLGRIVLDSAGLIFKHGRHLPKILKAGFKALKSFRSASKVEHLIAKEAEGSSIRPPYSASDVKQLMIHISRSQLEELVDNSLSLYDILFDRPLVRKIIEVIDHVIQKMEKRPEVYSLAEIKGMQLGREIIAEGDSLINRLNSLEQLQLVKLIEQIERDSVEELVRMSEESELF